MPAAMSIRVRLTLWYVLLLAVILAAFSGGVYLALRQFLYSNFDESLERSVTAFLGIIQYEEDRPTLALRFPSDDTIDIDRELFVRVFDISGDPTFDNSSEVGGVPVDARALDDALAGKPTVRSLTADGDPIRVKTLPIMRDGRISGVMEVGLAADDASDTLTRYLLIVGLAYPITLVLATFGGVFFARRALSPVDNVTRLARRISAEDLGQRLDLQLPDDEVGRLARTFDEMIARLDEAFRRQREFTADASHELRTPLTIIKGQIDVSLQKEREPEVYRQVLSTVNEEVDRLIRLAGSLLTLTRADAGQIPLTLEPVSVSDLVVGTLEQVRPLASQREIELQLLADTDVTIRADEDLLLQLLLNLLDNAIKYTPAGGQVTAGWSLDGDQVALWVRDTGPGIPEEHLPHLFDRFYRVDKSRSRAEGGVGLGLAISRWIAEAHAGSLSVESEQGAGSTFTVRLWTARSLRSLLPRSRTS